MVFPDTVLLTDSLISAVLPALIAELFKHFPHQTPRGFGFGGLFNTESNDSGISCCNCFTFGFEMISMFIRAFFATHPFAINANDKAVLLCEKWLSWFGSWSEFIAKNYLDDFVDDQKIEPIRFKPDTANDVKAFFEICSSLIEKRGKRMVEELKSRVL